MAVHVRVMVSGQVWPSDESEYVKVTGSQPSIIVGTPVNVVSID